MVRALIVNPPGPDGRGYIREGRCEQQLSSFMYRMLPVSLPSTAATLREAGHEVSILDAVGPRVTRDEIEPRVRAFDPDLVVVNMSTPTYASDVAFVSRLADITDAHLTAIGVHVTALASETLAGSRLSSVVRGEPEWTVRALADCLERGGNLAEVNGITHRAGGSIVNNPDRGFPDELDELPPPARDLLPEEDYFLPFPRRPYTLVIPTRGCPHKCTYCTAPAYYGRRLRRRSPALVVDEIVGIVERGVVRDVVMWSDTFTLDRAYVIAFCDELRRRRVDVRWMCNSRADCFDLELARAMRAAGCSGISFGLESGVQEILDRARKGTTVEQGRNAIAAAREAGIDSLGHFILGLPGETPATIRRTIDYAKEIDPDWAQFYCATALPGTEMRAQAERDGALVGGDWSALEFHRPSLTTSGLRPGQLRRARLRAYLEFYARPRVVSRVLGKVQPRDARALGGSVGGFVRSWVLDA